MGDSEMKKKGVEFQFGWFQDSFPFFGSAPLLNPLNMMNSISESNALLLKMFKEIKQNLKYEKDAIYEEHGYLNNEPNQTSAIKNYTHLN